MAGYSAVILVACPTPNDLDSALERLRSDTDDLLGRVASHREPDGHFWVSDTTAIGGTVVDEKPGGWPCWLGVDLYGRALGDSELAARTAPPIQEYFGVPPVLEALVCAYCNAPVNMRIVGEVVLFLAEKWDGMIDYHMDLRSEALSVRSGRALHLELECDRTQAERDVVTIADAAFHRAWLANPAYRLCR